MYPFRDEAPDDAGAEGDLSPMFSRSHPSPGSTHTAVHHPRVAVGLSYMESVHSMQQAADILHRVGTSLQHAMPFQRADNFLRIAEAGANATRQAGWGFWELSRYAPF